MKKRVLFFVALFVGAMGLFQTVEASTYAAVTWPCYYTTTGSSVVTSTTTGQVNALTELLSPTASLAFGSGKSVGSIPVQPIKYTGTYPQETSLNSSRYVRFAASPKTGSILTVDTISMSIAAVSSNNLKVEIDYSIDSTFQTSVNQLVTNFTLSSSVLSNQVFPSLGLVLNPGKSVYVRVYFWDTASGESGKYLALLNVHIGAHSDPIPVSSTIIWPCITDVTSSVTTGTMMSGGVTTLGSGLLNYGSLTYGAQAAQSVYTGVAWSAETAPVDGRYIQFAAAPKSGGSLALDSVKMKLAAYASNDLMVSVYYSTDPNFTLATGTKLGSDISVVNSAFTKTVAALSQTVNSGQVLYLRLYPYSVAVSGDQWKLVGLDSISVYGKVIGVTADPPTVTTTAITSISTTFATTGGTISSDGGAAVTDRGIVYSFISTTPTLMDSRVASGTGSGSFTTQLTGLFQASVYYARAYATNSAGTTYGSVMTFTTMAALTVPVLTTTPITSILAKTASGGGNVTDWGGSSVTTRGVCWSSVYTVPTITDSTCTNGNGIGSYTGSLNQLLPTTNYYVRAYAINSTGTGYGPVVTFTTQAVAADVIKTVGKDGCSDYNTIQAAFTAVPDNYTGRWIIYVKNGTYYEKCLLASTKSNVCLIGQNVDSCIVTYDDYAGKPSGSGTIGTTNSYSVAITANDFYAQNITFRNTIQNTGKNTYSSGGDQAVALRTNGDRQQYINCKLLGYQDTYYTNSNGRIYMKKCYIAGSVDYIFGNGVMVLDSCTTYCNRTGGVNCAPNTDAASAFGYVYLNCTLTSLAAGATDFTGSTMANFYLGRPWQNNPKAAYIKCVEPATLNSAGWTLMTTGLSPVFAEYQCTGPGSATTGRSTNVDYPGIQLTDAQALNYTISNVFSKNTNTAFSYNWLPTPGMVADVFFPATIHLPANGSLSVLNCSTNVINGDIVPVGANLTVTATPVGGYVLEGSGLTANASPLTNGGSYAVTGATVFDAQFSIATGLSNGSDLLNRIYCSNNIIHLGEVVDHAGVYNVEGKLVLVAENTSTMNASKLSAGIYIVKVSVKGQTQLSKVTK